MITVDTNVLVYSTAPRSGPKAKRAHDIIRRLGHSESGLLLLQALAELSTVAIRKGGLPADEVATMVDAWRGVFSVRAAEETDLPAALDVVTNHKLQFWDALLWATARRVGVRHILTEDFQDGQSLNGVRFINPFNPENDSIIDRILPA